MDIRTKLQDEISLKIYDARMELFQSGDAVKYVSVINELPGRREWFERLTAGNCNKDYSLFGAGEDTRVMLKFMEYYCKSKPKYIYDNNKELVGKKINDIIVSLPDKIRDSREVIYIAAVKYSKEILYQLESMGINRERIVVIGSNTLYEWNKKQYFDVFLPKTHEVFVDAGAYDATTAINFLEWCNGSYEEIYAFEVVKDFADISRQNLKKNHIKGKVIEKGLWSENTTLKFWNTGGQASQVITDDSCEAETIEVVSLDNYFKEKRVTFIKMDIEGSELEALKGAKNMIKKQKPRLAISLYHKAEDVVEIPEYILSLVSDYKLYLRTYGFGIRDDTVLYATT